MNPSFDDNPIAHVAEDGRSHALKEHLMETARRSSEFAGEFGAAGWGRLAGLWHDLGKFSLDFQKKIRGANLRVDHSTAGAIYAVEKFNAIGRILAYLIAGHHAGLPDWQTETSGLSGLAQRLIKDDLLKNALNESPPADIINQKLPSEKPNLGMDPALWIRMLFSCVVDADFLDTEAFFEPDKAKKRQDYQKLSDLLPRFNAYMEDKQSKAVTSPVNRQRADILRQCIEKSVHAPSIFTLTVPTGGGKTLSSMAFALNHSAKYGKRRIIYVIPYTSIIEQTANQFREIFGDNVIEHHSNLDTDDNSEEMHKARLACENWDAPIVVTTSVQFFESLFASRTSRCRKLHNIINSVVILDEAQLLPPDFLNPIIWVLKELHKNYGVTILLSTATQPALSPHRSSDFNFPGLPETVEIMEAPSALQKAFKRVKINMPQDINTPLSWEALSEELKRYESVLCIVNRRDDCRTLYKLMPEETIHLSALMCGAHRSEVIAKIRERLRDGIPTRVISTQLVEAGVDIDFPLVYRAVAGLDSIAQAAGRCNREGKLREGQLFVFVPPSKTPPGHLRQAAEIGKRLFSSGHEDPFSQELFEQFFKELFWLKGDNLDKYGILKDLTADSQLRFSFRTAASKFKIIDESGQAPILV
ncbi:MAG: CRISPR-associated helicase Cas3', partial [Deltaproteobacteria bacterium]|nr:CRISPR-associated helicase Cas3' [Deltaproteobacteria bacterium]